MLATQNPIESEGTYPLPEAQVDRFLFKLLVDYPTVGRRGRRRRPLARPACPSRGERSTPTGPRALPRRSSREVFVDRRVIGLRRPPGRRHAPPRAATASTTSSRSIEYGASPRGPIGLVQAGQALALLRGRDHVTATDVADLAPDVLRHRLVLSYDALADGVRPDDS